MVSIYTIFFHRCTMIQETADGTPSLVNPLMLNHQGVPSEGPIVCSLNDTN